jgi:hypothetical protein
MRVKAVIAGIVMPVLFLAAFLISTSLGYWRTESSKEPVKFETGEAAGEYNPADIRGSYTFSDLEEVFGISAETLALAYGFADLDNPGAIQVKMLEEAYGVVGDREIGTDSIRLFVALYKALPYSPEVDTALPQTAWEVLKREGAASEAALEQYRDSVVNINDGGIKSETMHDESIVSGESAEDVPPSPTGEEERLVKGNTTFGDLLSWGVPVEEIESVLGMTMGDKAQSLRVFCTNEGLEFSTVKTALQDLANAAP